MENVLRVLFVYRLQEPDEKPAALCGRTEVGLYLGGPQYAIGWTHHFLANQNIYPNGYFMREMIVFDMIVMQEQVKMCNNMDVNVNRY